MYGPEKKIKQKSLSLQKKERREKKKREKMADWSRPAMVFGDMREFMGTPRDYIELMLSRLFTGDKKVIDTTTAPPEEFWRALREDVPVMMWLHEHDGPRIVTPKAVLSKFLRAVFSSMRIEEKFFTAFVAIRKFDLAMMMDEGARFLSEEIFLILQLLQKSGLDLDKKVFLPDVEIGLPNDVLRSMSAKNTSVSYELARVLRENTDYLNRNEVRKFIAKLEDLNPTFHVTPEEFFGQFGMVGGVSSNGYIEVAISSVLTLDRRGARDYADSRSEIDFIPPKPLWKVIGSFEELWKFWTTKGDGYFLKIVPEIRRDLFTALFSFDPTEKRLLELFRHARDYFVDGGMLVTDGEMAFYDILSALVANGFDMDQIFPRPKRNVTVREYCGQLLEESIRQKYDYDRDAGEREVMKFRELMDQLGRGTYVKGAKSSAKLLLEKNGGDVEAAAQVMASTIMRPSITSKFGSAVMDAKYAEERERYKVRKVAVGEKDLEWTRIKGKLHVKTVSWMSKKGYGFTPDSGDYKIFNNTWVTLVPDVKNFIRERMNGITGKRKYDRLIRLLGIRPDLTGDNEKEGFVEFWVRPKDMFRPTPDPEIDDDIADLQLRDDVDPVHKAWFDKQVKDSYNSKKDPPYPWTRLGYTYDWADNTTTNQGPSEFIIRKDAPVVIIRKYTTDDYGKN
jgi:hypothetical protein